jgi:hypothetical protein
MNWKWNYLLLTFRHSHQRHFIFFVIVTLHRSNLKIRLLFIQKAKGSYPFHSFPLIDVGTAAGERTQSAFSNVVVRFPYSATPGKERPGRQHGTQIERGGALSLVVAPTFRARLNERFPLGAGFAIGAPVALQMFAGRVSHLRHMFPSHRSPQFHWEPSPI